jgi:two-component system chemotaxis sensor kinase CheA
VVRPDGDRAAEIMMIVEAEGRRVAALVDELLGQHQVVVKNLETNYRRVPDISGATILGDGRVALIVDTASLVKRARH